MKLQLRHVLARASERGYTEDEIRPCLTEDLGDGWYEVDVDHPAYPRTPRPGYEKKSNGLGDMVKVGLKKVGITEERVSKVIGKPCGCGKRAKKLNELGNKYLGLPLGSSEEDEKSS